MLERLLRLQVGIRRTLTMSAALKLLLPAAGPHIFCTDGDAMCRMQVVLKEKGDSLVKRR